MAVFWMNICQFSFNSGALYWRQIQENIKLRKAKRGKIKSNPTHVKEKKSQNEETVRTNCGVRFPSDRSKTYPGKCLNCCRQEQWQTKGHHENPLPPAVATRQRPRFHLNALPHTHTPAHRALLLPRLPRSHPGDPLGSHS